MIGGIRRYRRRTVVIHTQDDRSVRGVLLNSYRDCFVLAEPQYLQEANPTDLKGQAVIPTSNVSWLQILEG